MKISIGQQKKSSPQRKQGPELATQLVSESPSNQNELPYHLTSCHLHERHFVAAIVQLLSLGIDLGQRKQAFEKIYSLPAQELAKILNQLREICRHSRRFVISIAELKSSDQLEDAKIKAVNVLIPMRHEASVLRDEVELLLEDRVSQH